jgi:hypothetical protein
MSIRNRPRNKLHTLRNILVHLNTLAHNGIFSQMLHSWQTRPLVSIGIVIGNLGSVDAVGELQIVHHVNVFLIGGEVIASIGALWMFIT